VTEVRGDFKAGDSVDVVGPEGEIVARGLVRYDARELQQAQGRPTAELAGREVIHRDELVVLDR
ncbi:MAG: glutamate 5-kinase, partial [Actinomycetota bacterium]|nr:glutamate 5-kinase [Actinomycetota bacterium]